jgi:hypothetical protein
VTRTTTTQLIAEPLPNLNSRKRLTLKPNMDTERSLWPSFFLFEEINALKKQFKPEKTAGRLNLSSLLKPKKLTYPLVVMKARIPSTFYFF